MYQLIQELTADVIYYLGFGFVVFSVRFALNSIVTAQLP